jgi:hypothetical protein
MTPRCILFFVSITMLSASLLRAQGNVGIGTNSPTEKLEVGGIIYTNEGGVRFPDLTIQETAAFMSEPEDAGTPNGPVFMLIEPNLAGDTIYLVDVATGGIEKAFGGAPGAIPYEVTKELDKT